MCSFFSYSDAAVVGSLPHFYMGNKSLVNAVNGLSPKKHLHGTFLDIEPVRNAEYLKKVCFSLALTSGFSPMTHDLGVVYHVCRIGLGFGLGLRLRRGFWLELWVSLNIDSYSHQNGLRGSY